MKYYMHVNYLENVFEMEEIARRARAAGYDGIELRGWDIGGKLSVPDYIQRPCRAAKAAGLELVLSSLNDTTNPDAAVRSRAMESFRVLIRVAAENGVKVLNVFGGSVQAKGEPYFHFDKHGSTIATDEQFKWTAEYFRAGGALAAEHGITLCFETHNVYLHDLAEPAARLLEMIGLPNVKANFDWGNMYLNRRNKGMDDAIERLRGRIGYAHVKNMVAYNSQDSRLYRAAALRDGDINTFVFMRKLLASGFAGPIALENTLAGDKRHLMGEDLAYIKSIVEELV